MYVLGHALASVGVETHYLIKCSSILLGIMAQVRIKKKGG